jgi:hypothetical protein
VLAAAGEPRKFLQPDLAVEGLAKYFVRRPGR